MILHIGDDVAIPDKDIIVILDVDAVEGSKTMRTYLDEMRSRQRLITLAGDTPKSYIVVKNELETSVYASPISSVTLAKRCQAGLTLREI